MVKSRQYFTRMNKVRNSRVQRKATKKVHIAPPPTPPPEVEEIIPVKEEPIYINTQWELSVPKILHAYWGANKLPYIRYMTLRTFIKFNPDWKVILWHPKIPNQQTAWKTKEHNYDMNCIDLWQSLSSLPIEMREVDFTEWRLSNSMAEVHKSDFLRTYLLATQGGVWTDMDILYFNPITHLRVNKAINKDVETFVCISPYGHSTGFMMSCANNGFFEEMGRYTLEEYSPEKYQCIGPELYNKYGKTLDVISKYSSVANIDMEAVYAHDAHHISELLSNCAERFTPHSIGVHWYAGYYKWSGFINKTNGGMANLPNTIVGNVLRRLNKII